MPLISIKWLIGGKSAGEMFPCQWFGVVSGPGTRIAHPLSVSGKPRASGTGRGCCPVPAV